jgi:hypothetical protein
VVLTNKHKSWWRAGDRAVARYLAPLVGDLLVQVMAVVHPFAQFLRHRLFLLTQTGQNENQSPELAVAVAPAAVMDDGHNEE